MLRMNKNREFDNSESRLTCLINQLRDKLDNDENLNSTYNRLLIERALIRKKLAYKKSKNVLTNFCEKLNRMNSNNAVKKSSTSAFSLQLRNEKKQEKLICDYF